MPTTNVSQAATILNIHENRVLKLIEGGDLPAAKIGRAWVMMTKDVLTYIENQIIVQTQQRMGAPTRARRRGKSLLG